MTSFEITIRRAYSYLFEKWGFEFVETIDDYGGNIAIVQSEKLKIRFINDRADFFLDISGIEQPAIWIGFYRLMDQLKESGKVNIEYRYANKIGVISRLLEQYLSEIQKLFR